MMARKSGKGLFPVRKVPVDVERIQAEYEVTTYFFGKPSPQAVQVSFELDAHGWSRLEQSSEWRNLLEVLASLQKEQKHFVRSARIQR